MRVGLRGLDLDRVAPGLAVISSRAPPARTVASAAAEGRAWNSQSGVFLSFLLLPGHFFPLPLGPPSLAARAPPVVVTPQLGPPALSGARSPPWPPGCPVSGRGAAA